MDYPKTGCVGNGVCPADRIELIDGWADVELGSVTEIPSRRAMGGVLSRSSTISNSRGVKPATV